MDKINLLTTIRDIPVQMFPLVKGKMAKATGVFVGTMGFYCATAGNLTFTYEDATTETVAFVEGECFACPDGTASVTVVSGSFHLV